MYLNRGSRDRSYLLGRWIAVCDAIERNGGGEKGIARNFHCFIQSPYRGIAEIERQLEWYKRVVEEEESYLLEELYRIEAALGIEGFTNKRKQSLSFYPGFAGEHLILKRREKRRKKEKEDR